MPTGENSQLFAVISEPTGEWNPAADLTARHVQFLRDLESRGVTFLSGPLAVDATGWHGSGLTVIRADSIEHASQIMALEPYSVAGSRIQTIRSWFVTSGAMCVGMRLSDPNTTLT
jgi:uncharacterized protein YciI